MARQARRARRLRPRSRDPGADRRDHPRHLERHLRLGSPPLRGARALSRRGRHPRPRADGHRRGGRLGRHAHRTRRPRRHPLQHLLRRLLHVRSGPAVAVRDDAGARAGQGRGAVRLHEALRPGAGRPVRVPARPAGALRARQGAARAVRRPLRLPLRRAADRLAGGRVRRGSRGRHAGRLRPRPDRADVLPGRAAARRGARHRHRPRSRAARARATARRRGDRPARPRRHRRGAPHA